MPETTKKRTTAKKGKNGRTRNTAAKKNVILPEPEFIHSEVVIIMSFLAAAILFFLATFIYAAWSGIFCGAYS